MDAEKYQFTSLGSSLVERSVQLCLKAQILAECDATSKIGNKTSAVASKPESYIDDFGIELLRDSNFVCAEKYLVRVISSKSKCKRLDDLRS